MKFFKSLAVLTVSTIALAATANAMAVEASSSASTQATIINQDAENAPWDIEAIHPSDIVVGSMSAPVTIVEYASLTCPHCAHFMNAKMPELQKEWIETGKAKLIYRHFPIDKTAMAAAAVVNCMPTEERYAAIKALYSDINDWATKPLFESIPGVLSEALQREVNFQQELNECVLDGERQREALLPGFLGSQNGVASTPTFFVNGEKIVGFSPENPRQIDNEIIRALGAK